MPELVDRALVAARTEKLKAGKEHPAGEQEVEQLTRSLDPLSRDPLVLGLEALIGPLVAFTIRLYYVAATNQRLFVLRVWKRSAKRLTIEMAEAFDHVRIERRKSGRLWTQIWVRRLADDTEFRFRIVRTERDRAERVFGSLRAP